MPVRDVIIDCDTGVDDALALLLALRYPGFNVVGLTTVAGNVALPKVMRNTLIVAEHSGKSVPVYAGAEASLVGPGYSAEYVHGGDGLGDLGFPDPTGKIEDEHAVDYLIRTYMEATNPVELITLAPLTNIALALTREPALEFRIPSLVMMAGGINGGNSTPAAEFNVYVDPEAADIVFRSRIPKTMVGLDPIYTNGTLSPENVAQIEATDTPWCWVAGRLLRFQLDRYQARFGALSPVSPPDPAAMAIAIDPGLGTAEMRHVTVETKGEYTRGMTVVDRRRWRRGNTPDLNVNVVSEMDTEGYRRLFMETFLARP